MSTEPFQHKINCRPDFSMLAVTVPPGRNLRLEAASMAAMDKNLKLTTKMKGGLGRLLTSESLFVNEVSAVDGPGEILISPGAPGDIEHRYLRDETLYLQGSSYLASDPSVKVETKWQGLTKGFFSGESFFLIKCSGTGDLWFNTFGAMITLVDVDGSVVVDTGHIVGFTGGLDYSIEKLGGYKSLFFSGEGLVCRFKGQGTVWVQTRKPAAFARWASYYRPVKTRDS